MGVQPWPGPGWDPLGDLAIISQEMNRLFEHVLTQGPGHTQGGGGAWVPSLDVSETAEAVRVQVELPGVAERQIRIEFDGGVLTIRAERPPDPGLRPEQFQQVECRYGSFLRRLTLPSPVDRSGIRATCRDGVLEIRLPKPRESQRRYVPIEAG